MAHQIVDGRGKKTMRPVGSGNCDWYILLEFAIEMFGNSLFRYHNNRVDEGH